MSLVCQSGIRTYYSWKINIKDNKSGLLGMHHAFKISLELHNRLCFISNTEQKVIASFPLLLFTEKQSAENTHKELY